ncbi:MAG: hypothetical protein DRP93_00205 [Candidatus Neomarinimicrobiota bacterium]|nr:MAG: hypothetical protein DRP93_00205 [Candidatus Neomarinimicrobiota bacterium]
MDKNKLTDEEITASISSAISMSDDWQNSQLSGQRSDAYDLYFGSTPKQSTRGRSTYVSLDVMDSTESLKASLLNVFAGERAVVKFEQLHLQDKEQVDQANQALDFVINAQNDQYKIHHDTIHDGLLSKLGVTKTYYQVDRTSFDMPFEGSRDQLDMMLAEDEDLEVKEEIESEEITQVQPIPGTEFGIQQDLEMVKATLTKYYDDHQIKIDPLPPEEFLIDERATTCEDAVFTCHQREVTLSELREMGFDEDKVEEAGVGQSDTKMSTDYERISRNQYDSKGTFSTTTPIADESMAYLTLYEAYLQADYEGTGIATMRQVFVVNDVILEMTDVDRNPFHGFVPYPLSHKLHGQSVADRLGPVQVNKTKLTRAILDNAELNNNTRFIANVSQLLNPRELTDTRFGGVVRAKGNPASVVGELAKPQLSQQTFPTLQLLDTEKESRVGMNRLSQGLNEDALKPGNAARKVDQMLSVSQQRQKVMARQYGNYWKKVVEHTYELVVANYPYLEIPNPTGQPIMLDPQNWKSNRIAVISESLAFGESEAKAQQLLQFNSMLSADPDAKEMYTPQNKYDLFEEAFDLLGFVSPYLTEVDPNKPSPTQQAQLQMQQQAQQQEAQRLQLQMQQLQLAQSELQLKSKKIDNDLALAQEKLKLESMDNADTQELNEEKARLDSLYKADQIELDRARLALDRQMAEVESIIELQQGRAATIGN